MVRPLRDSDPKRVHLITTRTENGALWMIPSREINELIGGILARYQEIFEIRIYAYVFLSNHYHLLVQAPHGRLDEFVENLNREIARRINMYYGRRGNFWERRYDDQIVLSEADVIEAFTYITTNAVRHGLVSRASDWPGLSSFQQTVNGTIPQYVFTHHSKISFVKNRTGKIEAEKLRTIHKLALSPIPAYRDQNKLERRENSKKLFSEREKEIRAVRAVAKKGFLGTGKVLSQKPGIIPRSVSRSPRPLCYTKCSELRRQFRKEYKDKRSFYDFASMRYRLGQIDVEFPAYCFKPPTHRKPRSSPFIEMQLAA